MRIVPINDHRWQVGFVKNNTVAINITRCQHDRHIAMIYTDLQKKKHILAHKSPRAITPEGPSARRASRKSDSPPPPRSRANKNKSPTKQRPYRDIYQTRPYCVARFPTKPVSSDTIQARTRTNESINMNNRRGIRIV